MWTTTTADTQPNRMIGTITRIVADRGFGFIRAKNSSRDFFFHASGVVGGYFDGLKVAQEVDFVEETDISGRVRAVDVRVLDLAPATGDEPRSMRATDAGDDDDANTYDWGADQDRAS